MLTPQRLGSLFLILVAAGCSSSDAVVTTDGGSPPDGATDGASGGACATCIVVNGGATGNAWCQATTSCTKRSTAVAACDWGLVESDVGCTPQALAPTALGIDCRAPKNATDPRCPDGTPGPGTVGSGVSWNSGLSQLRGGFIDATNDRLVITYTDNGQNSALIGVDLETGARTVLSGSVNGVTKVGAGIEGLQYLDAKSGPDGWYVIARGAAATDKPVLLRINPANGDRTAVYDARVTAGACKIGAAAVDFATITATVISQRDLDPYIAVGPDASVYSRVYNGSFSGIAAFKGGVCTILSSDSKTPTLAKGTGAACGTVTGMVFQNGSLLALADYDWLVRFDPATGNRTVVSSHVSGSLIGAGDGLLSNFVSLSRDESEVYTTGIPGTASGYAPGYIPRAVGAKLANGDRASLPMLTAPKAQLNEVMPHPKHTDRMVLTTAHAVYQYEPASGNVVLLSF